MEKMELGLPSQTLVNHPKPASFNENPLEKCKEGLRGMGRRHLFPSLSSREGDGGLKQDAEGKCRQLLGQLKSVWGICGQFKAPLETS